MYHVLENNKLKLVVLVAALSLTGCVSQGKYDDLVLETKSLEQENGVLNEVIDLRGSEIAQLNKEQEELAIAMEQLVVAGLLKMELLADGLHLTLDDDILFDTGSADIKPVGRDALEKLVTELEDFPYQIVVIGHTDSVPIGTGLADKFPSNWELAGARATSVVRFMEHSGIPSQRLGAASFGSTQPIASNDNAEGQAENRRIEIRLRPVQRMTLVAQ